MARRTKKSSEVKLIGQRGLHISINHIGVHAKLTDQRLIPGDVLPDFAVPFHKYLHSGEFIKLILLVGSVEIIITSFPLSDAESEDVQLRLDMQGEEL